MRTLVKAAAVAAAAAAMLAGCQRGDEPAAAPKADPPIDNPAAPEAATVLSNRPEQKEFRDWRAACDNGAACVAFAPSTEPDQGWLRLALTPDRGAAPDVRIGLWSPGETGLAPTAPLTLTIDGRSFTTERIADADLPMGRVAGPDATPVVRALASGKTAVIRAGDRSVILSLAGAAATMLWIDERQGRLHTPGALVRVGEQPNLTRAPDLPTVAAGPAADQAGFGGKSPRLPATIEALPAVQSCRKETAWNEYVQKSVTSARLGPNQELWAVPCFAGAYNLGQQVFVTGPGGRDPTPVAFPTASGTPTETVVNAEYDPATRTLSAFNKGRGLGDCGITQRWIWTGRGFVLKQEREMRDCMGVPSELWPTLWRTR